MTEAKLRKQHLEQELRDYLATREVTEKELHDLKAWMRNGNSVYGNAWCACGEAGRWIIWLQRDP